MKKSFHFSIHVIILLLQIETGISGNSSCTGSRFLILLWIFLFLSYRN